VIRKSLNESKKKLDCENCETELIKMTSTRLENCDNAASNKCDKRSAPDGGFGWLIVIAYGTANVSLMPLSFIGKVVNWLPDKEFTMFISSPARIIQFTYHSVNI